MLKGWGFQNSNSIHRFSVCGGSWTLDPGSRIRIHDHISWIQDPRSLIQDQYPGSMIQDTGSWIQDPGSMILDPAFYILDLCMSYICILGNWRGWGFANSNFMNRFSVAGGSWILDLRVWRGGVLQKMAGCIVLLCFWVLQ